MLSIYIILTYMTDGQKIEKIQQMTGLSWKELAEKVGIANQQRFTDIRNGRHGISMKLCNRIIEAFPQIRREWLMFESGPITQEEAASTISLYGSAEDLAMGNTAVCGEAINVGTCFPKAEVAIRNNSDSMTEYPVGCLLVLKQVIDTDFLIPGNNYLVETDEFAVVKRVQKGRDEAHIALYSSNEKKYDDGKLVYEPFEIPVSSVRRIFCLLGYVFVQTTDINKA